MGSIDSLDDTITVIEAPRQSDLMIELIKKLKPQVVVTGIAIFEAVTSSAFVHLLDTTRDVGSRLFLDISDHFELSSLPGSNGVLKYLSGSPLPSHAAIICGLVKNKVIFHINLLADLDCMVGFCSGLTLINFVLMALTTNVFPGLSRFRSSFCHFRRRVSL
jgi:hypothetical protein